MRFKYTYFFLSWAVIEMPPLFFCMLFFFVLIIFLYFEGDSALPFNGHIPFDMAEKASGQLPPKLIFGYSARFVLSLDYEQLSFTVQTACKAIVVFTGSLSIICTAANTGPTFSLINEGWVNP